MLRSLTVFFVRFGGGLWSLLLTFQGSLKSSLLSFRGGLRPFTVVRRFLDPNEAKNPSLLRSHPGFRIPFPRFRIPDS